MKKGDLRKQEILAVAETLFCKKGYEKTSVQDILDQLNASKGSFYHHFPSKESLLEGICKKKAEHIYLITAEKVRNDNNTLSALNSLFSGMIPLCNEKMAFLLMLLPIFQKPEGKSIRQAYCEALNICFIRDVTDLLHQGDCEGILCCKEPEISGQIVLLLISELWNNISDQIIESEKKRKEPDLTEILRRIDQYRLSIEKILTLPYGSLTLTDIVTLRQVTEQIHSHWPVLCEI